MTAMDRVGGVYMSCSSPNVLAIGQTTSIGMNPVFVLKFAAAFICQCLYNMDQRIMFTRV